jgi:hypothetical protein
MPKRSSKQKDTQELARSILDQVVPDAESKKSSKSVNYKIAASAGVDEDNPSPEKNPAAVALGRLGGLKGGIARAEKLSSAKRIEIAKKAAKTRWSKKKKDTN